MLMLHAHRFKIDLTLTKKTLLATDDANFVELLRLKVFYKIKLEQLTMQF